MTSQPVTGAGTCKPASALYLRIPVSPGKDIEVTGSFPVTEAQWQMFIDVLAALKPGLVQTGPEAPA